MLGSIYVVPVEHQERSHQNQGSSLIPLNEMLPFCNTVGKRGCLPGQISIFINSVRSRTRQRAFETVSISNLVCRLDFSAAKEFSKDSQHVVHR